ncbi:MAG: hypothetical protein ACLFVJ_21820 [Persicimonas sp.]
MIKAVPTDVAQAAVDALCSLHGLQDDNKPALKWLTLDVIPWRAQGFEYWDLWCATAAAWAYAHVGEHLVDGQCVDLTLDPMIAKYFWASTSRLVGKGTRTYESQGVEPPIEVDPADVRAGDVLLIYTGRTDRLEGDHVALARGPHDDATNVIPTIEGNAQGKGPDGARMKGVVETSQSIDEIARVLRVPLSWMTGTYKDEL